LGIKGSPPDDRLPLSSCNSNKNTGNLASYRGHDRGNLYFFYDFLSAIVSSIVVTETIEQTQGT